MKQEKDSTPTRRGKHLKWNERILIEGFLRFGLKHPAIACQLGRDRRIINREVERGLVERLNSDLTTCIVYNANRAQDVCDKSLRRQAKRGTPLGRGIDDRPEEVASRSVYGHWEIDLVVSGKGKGRVALLTLVERKTRKLIIRRIKDKTQASVLRAINGIERSMGQEAFKVMFVSITADNGSEFLDYLALERSVKGNSSRTHIREEPEIVMNLLKKS